MQTRRRARRARNRFRVARPDFRPLMFLLVLTAWMLLWTMDAALSANGDEEAPAPGPLAAIGSVTVDGGRVCTGVLTGPRQVLTAAHCLWDAEAGRWMPARNVRFVAGATGAVEARTLSYWVAPHYDPTRADAPENLPHDWVLLDLDDGLRGSVTPLPVMTLDRARFIRMWGTQTELQMAGYGTCRALALDGPTGTLLHDCAARKGASGTPIIALFDGQAHVVALHVASAGHKGRRVGVAAPVRAQAAPLALLHQAVATR